MRLLDLFCGAGGAAMGYHRAGFSSITGIDHRPQKRYPFTFIQADALEFLKSVKLGDFDLIHASPPCQGYSRMRHLPWLQGRSWPMLIPELRERLSSLGIPWVIENVVGAPLPSAVILCGQMFGLPLYRHRCFESSHLLMSPPHLAHREVIGKGRMLNDRQNGNPAGYQSIIRGDTESAKRAMGIDWMTRDELTQSIPPAYTTWVGLQLRDILEAMG